MEQDRAFPFLAYSGNEFEQLPHDIGVADNSVKPIAFAQFMLAQVLLVKRGGLKGSVDDKLDFFRMQRRGYVGLGAGVHGFDGQVPVAFRNDGD